MASLREKTGMIFLIGGIVALLAITTYSLPETYAECMEKYANPSDDDEEWCDNWEKSQNDFYNTLIGLSFMSVVIGLGLYLSSKD